MQCEMIALDTCSLLVPKISAQLDFHHLAMVKTNSI